MSLFEELVNEVIRIEGGYSNHPSDSGGETIYGITIDVARRFGYQGPMNKMSLAMAKQIYRERYWDPLQLDHIQRISPAIVKELFDTGVNQGVGRAGEYLQTALNALNRQQRDYPDMKVDGQVGKNTLDALMTYVRKRSSMGEIVLLRALNCLQGAFYINLSQKRQKDEDFLYGWLQNRIVI